MKVGGADRGLHKAEGGAAAVSGGGEQQPVAGRPALLGRMHREPYTRQ